MYWPIFEATRRTNIIIYNNRRTFWSVKDEKILSYTTNRIMGRGWRFYDYRTHPALYEMQSAPWYFRVVVQGIGLVILVIIFLIAMRMVKKKIP